jgi:hypothetical protein
MAEKLAVYEKAPKLLGPALSDPEVAQGISQAYTEGGYADLGKVFSRTRRGQLPSQMAPPVPSGAPPLPGDDLQGKADAMVAIVTELRKKGVPVREAAQTAHDLLLQAKLQELQNQSNQVVQQMQQENPFAGSYELADQAKKGVLESQYAGEKERAVQTAKIGTQTMMNPGKIAAENERRRADETLMTPILVDREGRKSYAGASNRVAGRVSQETAMRGDINENERSQAQAKEEGRQPAVTSGYGDRMFMKKYADLQLNPEIAAATERARTTPRVARQREINTIMEESAERIAKIRTNERVRGTEKLRASKASTPSVASGWRSMVEADRTMGKLDRKNLLKDMLPPNPTPQDYDALKLRIAKRQQLMALDLAKSRPSGGPAKAKDPTMGDFDSELEDVDEVD